MSATRSSLKDGKDTSSSAPEASPADAAIDPQRGELPSTALRERPKRRARILRDPVGLAGLFLVVAFVAIAIFAPWIVPHDPLDQELRNRLLPPAWLEGGNPSYLLGADAVGRDLLSRIIMGSRISLLVGVVSVLLGGVLGVALGLIAGFQGGKLDSVIMRLADIQLAFPSLILAIAVMAILGQGLRNIILVLALTGWVQYARVVRARTLTIRETEFVLACRAVGVPSPRIMFRHILPNVVSPIIVVASFSLPQIILTEASLSFLGIGVPLPTPTWGNMLSESQDYVATAWWLSVWPGVAIMLCLLGINLLGDAIRDALDPRLKNL